MFIESKYTFSQILKKIRRFPRYLLHFEIRINFESISTGSGRQSSQKQRYLKNSVKWIQKCSEAQAQCS